MKIPEKEQENLLSIYWQLLSQIESGTDPLKQPLDRLLVESGYAVLNRIGYTTHRARWHDKLGTFHEPKKRAAR